MFPFVTVVDCPEAQMIDKIGPTLVCSAITCDPAFRRHARRRRAHRPPEPRTGARRFSSTGFSRTKATSSSSCSARARSRPRPCRLESCDPRRRCASDANPLQLQPAPRRCTAAAASATTRWRPNCWRAVTTSRCIRCTRRSCTDEPNVSRPRVLFGGINIYLQQHSALFRKAPELRRSAARLTLADQHLRRVARSRSTRRSSAI